jgi:hypothetical protein
MYNKKKNSSEKAIQKLVSSKEIETSKNRLGLRQLTTRLIFYFE